MQAPTCRYPAVARRSAVFRVLAATLACVGALGQAGHSAVHAQADEVVLVSNLGQTHSESWIPYTQRWQQFTTGSTGYELRAIEVVVVSSDRQGAAFIATLYGPTGGGVLGPNLCESAAPSTPGNVTLRCNPVIELRPDTTYSLMLRHYRGVTSFSMTGSGAEESSHGWSLRDGLVEVESDAVDTGLVFSTLPSTLRVALTGREFDFPVPDSTETDTDAVPVLPEAMTEEIVAAFLAEHEITTVEKFVAALPPPHKTFFTTLYQSESPVAEFVSPLRPRVISWGADADFVVTWTTDSRSPSHHQVEFLEPVPDEGRWTAGVIDFSGDTPEITHPENCSSCHTTLNRPLWPAWDEAREGTESDGSDSAKAITRFVRSGPADGSPVHPRLEPLDRSSYDAFGSRYLHLSNGLRLLPALQFSNVLVARHAEVLFGRLRAGPGYDEFVSSIICNAPDPSANPFTRPGMGFFADLGDEIPIQLRDLRFVGEGDDVLAQSEVERDYWDPYVAGGSMEGAVLFLMYHDAYMRNDGIRFYYRNAPNHTLGGSRGRAPYRDRYLIHPAGTVTAEVEFLEAYETHFGLRGQEHLDSLAEGGVGYGGMGFFDPHVLGFQSRLCTALTGAGPEAGGFEGPHPPPAQPVPPPGSSGSPPGSGPSAPPPAPGPSGPPPAQPPPAQPPPAQPPPAQPPSAQPPPAPEPPPAPAIPPTASFTLSADCEGEVCRARTGVAVVLRDTSSGAVRSREWDFGDGGSSRGSAPRHAWEEPGFYTVRLMVTDGRNPSTSFRTVLVEAADPAGACRPDAHTRCLRDSRYSVRVQWRAGDGDGSGMVVPAGTNESGMFRFFDPDNWEVVVKVLDGCSTNGHHWVFGASTTDLGYRITVTDTVTGEVGEYLNEPGSPAPAIADTKAFPGACDRD